jgi:energy-coupling factor transporter ATP-binding protein EcfA2
MTVPLESPNGLDALTLERKFASLSRRLAFAGDSWFLFDRLFSSGPLSPFARVRYSQTARIPDHAARTGFDLVECLRTASLVPDIGNVELALLDVNHRVAQHPRYLSYWHDPALHSMVGMIVGVDMIRHGGKYYVVEFNHGPSIYPRRRELYDVPFDPLVSGVVSTARDLGFESVVPIAFQWNSLYVDEFERAGRQYGISAAAHNCPLDHPGGARRLVALPRPLPPKTMYVIHSGLMSPLCRYIDNKWYTARWLEHAIANELPAGSLLAIPPTYDKFVFPREERGKRWPNVVAKLAGGARSNAVIAGRFEDEDDARRTLGLTGRNTIPKQLRSSFASSLLFYGRERVIFQEFIPPELDHREHAQLYRLHLLVSPLATMYLSAHLRTSRGRVPDRAPRGIIRRDNAFVFNDADYQLLSPAVEEEIRFVAGHLGTAMQRAIVRKFETVSC